VQGEIELEGLAGEVRCRAGLGEMEVALASTIATRILGADGVRVSDDLVGPAYLCRRVDGGYQIVVRATVPDIRFAITHELAHYAIRELARAKLESAEEERAANYLAAAILAPPAALRLAHKAHGNTLRALRPLAEAFGLSQTSIHLRLAEVLGDDRALVTANQNHVLSRGSRWETISAVSVAQGRVQRPDVAKATLRGGIDEGRVALRLR